MIVHTQAIKPFHISRSAYCPILNHASPLIGDEFEEKEEFVTSAYRAKIEEQTAHVEKIKKQDEEDEKNDVMKQKNMGKFYQNLLSRNVAMGGEEEEEVKKPAVEKGSLLVTSDLFSSPEKLYFV